MAWVKVERAEKKVEPFSVDFAYTGSVQEYVVPATGLYKLEVWGSAGGASGGVRGGYGGYSVGYRKLVKNTKIYVACGNQRYNGGGSPRGGGATHIALVTGLLNAIGKTIFDQQGLIVAGGGGGGDNYGDNTNPGGSGGGLKGGLSTYSPSSYQATQTSGYAFGLGGNSDSGGGGGYYGGYGNNRGGCGGSGWIGGVPEITYKGTTYTPSTSNGANNGNGKAKISFITK